jgi:hypothetical protein
MCMKKNIEPKFDHQLKGYRYLGRGPSESWWSRSSKLIYRCVECGDVMKADHNDYFNCSCGSLHLDIDYGRFGSDLGDNNILVYEKI